MSFMTEMKALGEELLAPAEFGEAITFRRKGAGYDANTRKATAGGDITQTLNGTLERELTPSALAGQLVEKHDAIIYAAPAVLAGTGFTPKEDDEADVEGKTWRVKETAHVVKQGVAILWICGVQAA